VPGRRKPFTRPFSREYKKILRQMEIRRKAGAGEEEALYQAFLSVHGKEREANMAGGARNG